MAQVPQPLSACCLSNRGHSIAQWVCGPREFSRQDQPKPGVTSLFVDSIPQKLPPSWLRVIFERVGKVDDVYISKKPRKHTKECFAFVRFRKSVEAMKAIEELDGYSIRGRKIKVSLAKFSKGGSPIHRSAPQGEHLKVSRIMSPAFRDHRTYRNALLGEKASSKSDGQRPNIIPVACTLHAEEDETIVEMLKYAVVAENTEVIDMARVSSEVPAVCASVKGMFSLSPTKILLSF